MPPLSPAPDSLALLVIDGHSFTVTTVVRCDRCARPVGHTVEPLTALLDAARQHTRRHAESPAAAPEYVP